MYERIDSYLYGGDALGLMSNHLSAQNQIGQIHRLTALTTLLHDAYVYSRGVSLGYDESSVPQFGSAAYKADAAG